MRDRRPTPHLLVDYATDSGAARGRRRGREARHTEAPVCGERDARGDPCDPPHHCALRPFELGTLAPLHREMTFELDSGPELDPRRCSFCHIQSSPIDRLRRSAATRLETARSG
jgi:hypothetical protein